MIVVLQQEMRERIKKQKAVQDYTARQAPKHCNGQISEFISKWSGRRECVFSNGVFFLLSSINVPKNRNEDILTHFQRDQIQASHLRPNLSNCSFLGKIVSIRVMERRGGKTLAVKDNFPLNRQRYFVVAPERFCGRYGINKLSYVPQYFNTL